MCRAERGEVRVAASAAIVVLGRGFCRVNQQLIQQVIHGRPWTEEIHAVGRDVLHVEQIRLPYAWGCAARMVVVVVLGVRPVVLHAEQGVDVKGRAECTYIPMCACAWFLF